MQLLELVGETGSIAAASRAMGMSYRRAWRLVDSINQCFRAPAVATRLGGVQGGGAELTALGRDVVRRYRAMERKAQRALAGELAALEAQLSETSSTTPDPQLDES